MKKFLKDLEKELKKLKFSEETIKEILNDHEEMLNVATEDGLSEEEITNKFGDPEKIASEIYEDSKAEKMEVKEEINNNTDKFTLFKSFPVLENVEEVLVNLIAEDLDLHVFDGENIEVHCKKVKEKDLYDVDFKDGKFSLERKKTKVRFSIFGRDDTGDFRVKIPRGQKLENLSVKMVSGDVEILSFSTKELDIKTTSGDVEMKNVTCGAFNISTVSGDIEAETISIESDLKVSTVSGDFEIQNGTCSGDIIANTVSGDFEFENVTCKELDFKTVSGDLSGSELYPSVVYLKSVSGDIEISNNDKTRPIEVGRKKTLSGDISIK